MAIDDNYIFQVQTNNQARKMTNNLGYKQVSGSATNDTAKHLNEAWEATLLPLYQDLLATAVAVECFYSRGLIPAQSVPAELNFQDTFGTRTGDPQPNDNAWSLLMITDSNSSRDNGIMFISGSSDNDVSAIGGLELLFLNNEVQGFASELENILVAVPPGDETWELTVINRIDNGIKLDPPSSNKVVNVTPKDIFYTQRRRRTKRTAVV